MQQYDDSETYQLPKRRRSGAYSNGAGTGSYDDDEVDEVDEDDFEDEEEEELEGRKGSGSGRPQRSTRGKKATNRATGSGWGGGGGGGPRSPGALATPFSMGSAFGGQFGAAPGQPPMFLGDPVYGRFVIDQYNPAGVMGGGAAVPAEAPQGGLPGMLGPADLLGGGEPSLRDLFYAVSSSHIYSCYKCLISTVY